MGVLQKVLINTSDSEDYTNTFIQTAKAATSILSYKVNPDNFLEKHNCGICANGSINKIADALMTILKENRYINIGQNARKYVENHHDIAEIVQQYKDLFGVIAK